MFYYALVNPGFEDALIEEVGTHFPGFHRAFSKPGFVTFKAPDDAKSIKKLWAPRWAFARCVGIFLQKCKPEELEQTVQEKAPGAVLHRFDLATQTGSGDAAEIDRAVADAVFVSPTEVWLGIRKVKPFDWGIPGGIPNVNLPEEAPSRAYLKLEEMMLWSGYAPKEDAVAVELGSAPGGASYALLKRGFSVCGVDVAPMAPICAEHPRFTHVRLSVRDVRKKHLPPRIDVLVCDLGLSPVEAIPQIRHLCQIYPSISQLFYTMKLGKGLKTAQIDAHLDAIKALGFHVKTTHLASNRMELVVVGSRTRTAED